MCKTDIKMKSRDFQIDQYRLNKIASYALKDLEMRIYLKFNKKTFEI